MLRDSTTRFVRPSVGRLVSYLVGWLVGWLAGQLVSWSVTHSFDDPHGVRDGPLGLVFLTFSHFHRRSRRCHILLTSI